MYRGIKAMDTLNRVVIPKEVRKMVGINPYDELVFEVDNKNRIVMSKVKKNNSLEDKVNNVITFCTNNIEATPLMVDIIDMLR